jgi:hypothetical protein
MKRPPRSRLAVLLLAATVPPGTAAVPDWLSGPPDTEHHPEREALYAHTFEDVRDRCGVDPAEGTLARLRLVGAVNHAVEDWTEHRRPHYRAMLRYLSVAARDPVHCEFRLDGEAIGQALADD